MNKVTRDVPCIFNTYTRTDAQIAMKAGCKIDLTEGFTVVPPFEDVPRLMKNHVLVTAFYQDGYRRRDHLEKIIGLSIDVDHKDKGRSTTDEEGVKVVEALGSPECFWTISARGGLHIVTWLPSCLKDKSPTEINSSLDVVRSILADYTLPEGWYIDKNAKVLPEACFPGVI